ncbi:hypothetical protein FKW77_010207 [Venturia effusa]|uniref:Uncharacterized protein n=1 Tax=Venturia effusa TaxID=50376 RepID=A0A517L2A7_9PEZI|nr:hypothetical protein FKW77_010207 [Venturia effusa]
MASPFSSTSDITFEPTMLSLIGIHSTEQVMQHLQLDVQPSHGHVPMDGEVLITCCACGNGPFVGNCFDLLMQIAAFLLGLWML